MSKLEPALFNFKAWLLSFHQAASPQENIQSSAPPTLQLGHRDFKLGIRGTTGCWLHPQSSGGGGGGGWRGQATHAVGQDTYPGEPNNGWGGGGDVVRS